MKSLDLCKTCEEREYCFERCLEAIVAEQEDHSDCYMKEPYKPMNVDKLCERKGERND